VWKLPWLIHAVAARGGAAMISEVGAQLAWELAQLKPRPEEVGAQLAWERAQLKPRPEEAVALKLLHQALVMGAAAWEGLEGPGNVAPQVIGRLGGLDGGAGGKRVARLVEDAIGWDGGGRAWLRPVRSNFEPPGGPCEAVLRGHSGIVLCLISLGDGLLASASLDTTVRVWDAASGVCLRVLEGHSGPVKRLAALDDGRLASSSWDQTVRVWDAASGVCPRVLTGHTSRVNCLTAIGGGRLASAANNEVRVWDATSGKSVELSGHRGWVRSLTALGSEMLASASDDKTVRVWNVESGACVQLLAEHTDRVRSVIALGIAHLASASWDKTVRVWDALGGTCLRVLAGHADHVLCVISLGNGRLASASADKTVRVWSTESDECVHTLAGHTKRVNSVSALKDGRLASASADGTVRLWDASGVCETVLNGHTDDVRCVATFDDKNIRNLHVASASDDCTVRVWGTAARILRELEGHSDPFMARIKCMIKLGNEQLASVAGTTVRVWDSATGKCRRELEGHTELVHCLVDLGNNMLASTSGCTSFQYVGSSREATVTDDDTVRVWKLDATEAVCLRVLRGHKGCVTSAIKLNNGLLASASFERQCGCGMRGPVIYGACLRGTLTL
jgi:WD40 repeat protein